MKIIYSLDEQQVIFESGLRLDIRFFEHIRIRIVKSTWPNAIAAIETKTDVSKSFSNLALTQKAAKWKPIKY